MFYKDVRANWILGSFNAGMFKLGWWMHTRWIYSILKYEHEQPQTAPAARCSKSMVLLWKSPSPKSYKDVRANWISGSCNAGMFKLGWWMRTRLIYSILKYEHQRLKIGPAAWCSKSLFRLLIKIIKILISMGTCSNLKIRFKRSWDGAPEKIRIIREELGPLPT